MTMKKITLWKSYDPNPLFGGYQWHLEPVNRQWDCITSEPHTVCLPDDFYIDVNTLGQKMIFKQGCEIAYSLTIGKNCENGNPYLIGGHSVESIKLKVLKDEK